MHMPDSRAELEVLNDITAMAVGMQVDFLQWKNEHNLRELQVRSTPARACC